MSDRTCRIKKTLYDETSSSSVVKTNKEIPGAPASATSTVTITKKTPPPSSSTSEAKNTDFQYALPSSVMNEINIIKKQTERDNKEKSLTFCLLNDKLFVGNYARGDENATSVLTCHKKFGKNAKKIGDAHTHPFSKGGTIGSTPSEADFVANLGDSYQTGIPQISCVVGAGKKSFMKNASHVHCFQPKESALNDPKKLRQYNYALMASSNVGNDVHPYFRENIDNDFYHIWYRKDGRAITANQEKDYNTSKELFDEMLGNSKQRLKDTDIKDMEKGSFCDLIQAYNMPDNDNIRHICRIELEKRDIYKTKELDE